MLQEGAMQKLSKTVMRPRYPREWLGRDTVDGIRRLVTSSSIGHVEDRCIKSMPHQGGVREWRGDGGRRRQTNRETRGRRRGGGQTRREIEKHTHIQRWGGAGGGEKGDRRTERKAECVGGGGGRRDANTQTGSRRTES